MYLPRNLALLSWESCRHVVNMSSTCCDVVQIFYIFKKDMAVWTPIIRKIQFFVCRAYQRITLKFLALYFFNCIFDLFTMSGVEWMFKNSLHWSTFLCPKGQAFFSSFHTCLWHVRFQCQYHWILQSLGFRLFQQKCIAAWEAEDTVMPTKTCLKEWKFVINWES